MNRSSFWQAGIRSVSHKNTQPRFITHHWIPLLSAESSHVLTIFFMIHFNNIFQSIFGSPNLCRPFKFSDQNFVTPRSKTPYWETDSCSPVQEIPHLSYIPNIHNCVLNKQPLYLYQDSWTQLIFSQPVSSLLTFKLSFHPHLFSLSFRFLKLFFYRFLIFVIRDISPTHPSEHLSLKIKKKKLIRLPLFYLHWLARANLHRAQRGFIAHMTCSGTALPLH
jgi:hypothetical protein